MIKNKAASIWGGFIFFKDSVSLLFKPGFIQRIKKQIKQRRCRFAVLVFFQTNGMFQVFS
jgi:hypothetical protein